jgi:chromosome segregation ATPase
MSRAIRTIREEISNLEVTIGQHRTEYVEVENDFVKIAEGYDHAKKGYDAKCRTISQLEKSLEKLQSEAQQAKKKMKGAATVSDHAIVRYMERVMKLDIESVRKTLVGTHGKKIIITGGEWEIDRGEYSVIIKDHSIVTVLS